MAEALAVRVTGPVRIVGAGLLGASIGQALSAAGVDVALADASPSQLRLAIDYGAGRAAEVSDHPALIVVATPPDVVAEVIERELRDFPDAVVTDVASVKLLPLQQLRERGVDISRYIGSHPLAGRERGGALSARSDLFVGRSWVVCRDEETSRESLAQVEALALELGAIPIEMSPEDHDAAVALTSHVPQLLSSALAGRLQQAPDEFLRLAGQGVRDVTRIAASSPELWVQILEANSAPVVSVLDPLIAQLSSLRDALAAGAAPGSRRTVAEAMKLGNEGVERLPGKHGVNRRFEALVVLVDDTPGQLAKLLGELGQLEVNVEDLRLEHSPAAGFGVAEMLVEPGSLSRAVAALNERGWRVVDE